MYLFVAKLWMYTSNKCHLHVWVIIICDIEGNIIIMQWLLEGLIPSSYISKLDCFICSNFVCAIYSILHGIHFPCRTLVNHPYWVLWYTTMKTPLVGHMLPHIWFECVIAWTIIYGGGEFLDTKIALKSGGKKNSLFLISSPKKLCNQQLTPVPPPPPPPQTTHPYISWGVPQLLGP